MVSRNVLIAIDIICTIAAIIAVIRGILVYTDVDEYTPEVIGLMALAVFLSLVSMTVRAARREQARIVWQNEVRN